MEITSLLRAGFALVIVLGLIALIAYLARRFGLAGNGAPGRAERRLSVVETMTLDPKRRVLLIKCDQTEHLILLGPSSETVLTGAEQPRLAMAESAPPTPSVESAQAGLSPASLRGPVHSAAQPPEQKPQPKTLPDGRREPQLPPPYRPRETK
jgi:flagellar protein FliO/FliZ